MRRKNGCGSVRKTENGYECVVQSSKCTRPNGKALRIKRRAATYEAAVKKAKEALIREELKQNDENEIQSLYRKPFRECMGYYMKNVCIKKVAASTYAGYTHTLNSSFYDYPIADCPVSKLTVKIFQIHYDSLRGTIEDVTLSNVANVINNCCKWMENQGFINSNYSKMAFPILRKRKDEYIREEECQDIKKVFTAEDIKKFYYAYQNNITEIAPAVILMLETMMRGQEFLALTMDDIDLENRIIHIRSAQGSRFKDKENLTGKERYIKVPKNGEARITVLSPLAVEVTKKIMEQTKIKCPENKGNFFFPTYKGGKGGMRSMDSFEQSFKRLCEMLQIDRGTRETQGGKKRGLNVHALRHSADTIANTAKGANVVNTALMAGHKAINMENVYTHQTVEALRSVKTASTEILKLDKNLNPSEPLYPYEVVHSKDYERVKRRREELRMPDSKKPTAEELYQRLKKNQKK